MKKLKYIVVPIVIGVTFAFSLNWFLEKEVVRMLSNNDLNPVLFNADSVVKNKGYFANNFLSNKDNILMFGSSELSHSTRQHPDYYFNTGKIENGIVTIGKAYTQDLQHSTVLGSLDNPSKKVVLLLSMQWFMDKGGVTDSHFQGRFSPVQFYRFMDNKKISDETKMLYAKRVTTLLKSSNEFQAERQYALDYMKKRNNVVFEPYYNFKKFMVNLKDKGLLYKELLMTSQRRNKDSLTGKYFDWKFERKRAYDDAIKRVGKKDHILGGKKLYIDKGYYKKNLFGKDKFFLNKYKDVDLTKSVEYEDLDIFLKTCRDLKIKPIVILTPSMDEFYSYTGITTEKREAYYAKIRDISKSYGISLMDLTEYDKSKFYLRDVMHIGTLGWVDICERLYNAFEDRN
ncbi:MAG: D-alanyl-lipoteichoic acid biosynthesis protein DltD [Peptostreptococcus porci]|nr:D-alanyl-lipoteichoic acid biosynthesis protein DltD [Peptostreptococcus porci]